MATTLKDVASLARVSVRTVSNVVNGYPHVSDEVRRRVRAAVDELGYRPNLAARALRTGRTGVLALARPGIDAPCSDDLVREVVAAAADRGYRVVVEQCGPGHPASAVAAGTTQVDGVLLVAHLPFEPAWAAPAPHVPVVLLGERGRDAGHDQVAVDTTRAAQDATEHLLRLGRRRIAAIGLHPRESRAEPQARTVGYHRALGAAGLTPPTGYLQPALHHRRAEGYHGARALLAQAHRPDAIFCYSDLLAIGAVRAAFDAGLRVPEDVAVIGVGDTEEGRYSRPTLSTVSIDTAFLARAAVARIAARIDRPDAVAAAVTVPHTVLPRESTG